MRSFNRRTFLILSILSALLAACGTSEGQTATASPAAVITPTASPVSDTGTQVSAAPTATPSPPPPPGAPRPSATPGTPPTLPPGVTPTAHIPAVIHLFHVSPFQDVHPGDVVTVVWEAEGNNAMICQVPPTGPTDCADVPMSGERQFTVLHVDQPYWLVLYVNTSPEIFPNAEQIEVANLYIGCPYRWFFDQPEVAVCPQTEPIVGNIAAQQFERGWMLYVEQVGRYLGLVDQPIGGSWESRTLLRVFDPLNILRDTSSEVTAPSGFHAPTSGFGYVWRGDVEIYQDWRGLLGWGLAAEFGYTGTYQCDDSVARWQFCYVVHPEGWLVVLHPNVNWYPKSVTILP